jgi:hypothetical protein
MRPRIVSPIALGARDDPFLLEHVEHRECRSLATGLPTYVPPIAESPRRVHDLGASDHAGKRQAGGDRLRDVTRSGSTPSARCPTSARACEAGLHLVDDEDDPVLVADRAHAADELRRRDDETALALNRLEHDRGDVLGRDLRHERPLQRLQRFGGARPAVLVRERHTVDLRRERPEARLVRVRLRGEAEREQRPAVEAALEGDDRRAGRCTMRANLIAVLDRLGARVEERRLGGLRTARARTASRRARCRPRTGTIVKSVCEKRESCSCAAATDLRVRVADVQAADAAGEVDERVAVDVRQRGALGLRDDHGQEHRQRVRDDALFALENLP